MIIRSSRYEGSHIRCDYIATVKKSFKELDGISRETEEFQTKIHDVVNGEANKHFEVQNGL